MGTTKTDLFTSKQNELAMTAKAIAHPARIAIIDHLLKSESCINSDLIEELGLAQATISQHLRGLKEVGIIAGSIDGTRMCYCINAERWKEIKKLFQELFEQFNAKDMGDCC